MTKKNPPTAAERARSLRRYVYLLTSNEKRFPKRYRGSMIEKIESLTDSLITEIRLADEIYPIPKQSFDLKITHYREALAIARTLDTHFCDIAEMPYFMVSDNQIKNISRDICSITNMITSLIKTMKHKFPEYDDEA